VVLTAYGPDGSLLGSVEKLDNGTDLGIETDAEAGIAKVLVVSRTESPETIAGLMLDYVVPRLFTTYVPHLAASSGGDVGITTAISILNLSNTTAMGTVTILDSEGQPLALAVDGSRVSSLSFELLAFGSKTFNLGPPADASPGSLLAGYARLRSSTPVEASVVFSTRDSANLVQEVGISSTPAFLTTAGAVTAKPEESKSTAVALVNSSAEDFTSVDVLLIGESQAGGVFERGSLVLKPGEHRAQFVHELFPNVAGKIIAGSLIIQGDCPVASTVLQTVDGVAAASVPVGSPERSSVR